MKMPIDTHESRSETADRLIATHPPISDADLRELGILAIAKHVGDCFNNDVAVDACTLLSITTELMIVRKALSTAKARAGITERVQ